ncbi:MAG: hypothetical protein U9P12_01475, partial [Verrucomicrobiota bacterium]|nr:hypothetical protein [Verrucomicrobiota bacterium]
MKDYSVWFDDPVAGSVMTAGDAFSGNRFDVQEWDWRAPNTASTTTFDGTLVVGSASAKICLQYAADWHLAGMDIDGYALIRPHRAEVSMSVADLALGSSGTLGFRTLTGGNNAQNLSVANISGSGSIQFGTSYANDTNALWNLSVSDATPEFTGSVVLLRGQLTFGSVFALDSAKLLIVEAEDNRVVLANDVSFGSVEFGAGTLAPGTYTATELNTALGTDRFSGSGILTTGSSEYYVHWTASYPALGSSTNYTDDPDADGMNNLAEYALGGNPVLPDAETVLPTAGMDAAGGTNWLNYAYSRRLDAEARGLSYAVLSGDDLLGTISRPTEEVGSSAVDPEFETVTNRMPTSWDLQGFMQLKIATAAGAGQHPRLFFCEGDIPAIRQKVQSGWLKEAFDEMKANADLYMTVSTNPYPISGSGNGTATAGRAINERVNTLALTGMILDDDTYMVQAIDICMSAIAQTDVNDFDSYNGGISVGDAMHAYAVAYDWLYNHMDEGQQTSLCDEIMEFGSWMYNYSVYGGYYYGRYEPTPLSCNHNAVSHGALGLAALATSSHPEWRELAQRQIGGYFQYARDAAGYNYEGIGYFGYGSLNAQTFSVALRREAHGDLVAAQPKNFSIPEWILRFVQPWGSKVVALNDNPERLGNSSGMMQLIAQNQDHVGLWAWLKMYGPDGDETYGGPVGGYIGDACTIPYIILFADALLQPVSPADAGLPLGKFFPRGSGSFRSSWQDDAALATFTCGFDQHRGHNHRDENSFTFSAFGEYFAIDPGY